MYISCTQYPHTDAVDTSVFRDESLYLFLFLSSIFVHFFFRESSYISSIFFLFVEILWMVSSMRGICTLRHIFFALFLAFGPLEQTSIKSSMVFSRFFLVVGCLADLDPLKGVKFGEFTDFFYGFFFFKKYNLKVVGTS